MSDDLLFGGSDGSVLLNDEERLREDNVYDGMSNKMFNNAKTIAVKFGCSVADVLAVCGSEATRYLGGPDIIQFDVNDPFLVGRLDSIVAGADELPPRDADIATFAALATKFGFTLEELTALIGSHSIVANKACQVGGMGGDWCNPLVQDCRDEVDAFKWNNSFFNEACATDVTLQTSVKNKLGLADPTPFTTENKDLVYQGEACKFTSDLWQFPSAAAEIAHLEDTHGGFEPIEATVAGQFDPIVPAINPVTGRKKAPLTWPYTGNDVHLAHACQRKLDQANADNVAVGDAMNKFKDGLQWDPVYVHSYKKMLSLHAKWAVGSGYPITGFECPSGYKLTPEGVIKYGAKTLAAKQHICQSCNVNYLNVADHVCPPECVCYTAIPDDKMFLNNVTVAVTKSGKLITDPTYRYSSYTPSVTGVNGGESDSTAAPLVQQATNDPIAVQIVDKKEVASSGSASALGVVIATSLLGITVYMNRSNQ